MDMGLTVTVSRIELLSKVLENRDKYAKILDEARAAYRAKVIDTMKQNLMVAETGGPLKTHIALDEPPDYLAEYDSAIDMLKMSTDETITLKSVQFDALVRNRWQWMGHAKMSLLNYCASASALPDTD